MRVGVFWRVHIAHALPVAIRSSLPFFSLEPTSVWTQRHAGRSSVPFTKNPFPKRALQYKNIKGITFTCIEGIAYIKI